MSFHPSRRNHAITILLTSLSSAASASLLGFSGGTQLALALRVDGALGRRCKFF
jgi:hypothetical protein